MGEPSSPWNCWKGKRSGTGSVGKPLEIETVLDLGLQIADAYVAHSKGIFIWI